MHALTHRLNAVSAAVLIGLSLIAPSAHAFADDEARRAILELRTQIQQLTDQNRQARLQLADQMDQLHQEIALLRGKVEELSHRPPTSSTPGNAPQAASTGDPQQRAAYEAAADLYRNGRYKEAAASFATFVQSYPNGEQTGDAMFYLGSSQYASKDFSHSIQTMESLVQARPNDPRAPDALLVVAADQIELNDLKGAKASLQRIIKDYPGSSAAETAKSRLKLL